MKPALIIAAILSLSAIVFNLWPDERQEPQSASAPASSLADFRFGKRWRQQWKLPDGLHEVSGVAVVDENTVLIHNDEIAAVFQYSVDTQNVRMLFQLEDPALTLDIEGIAILGSDVFLMTSSGFLYRIIDGINRSGVVSDYKLYDTGLGEVCELEGLGVDLDGQSLVLACKKMYDKDSESTSLYRFSSNKVSKLFDLPLASLPDKKQIHPTGITTQFGHYILVAGKANLLLEINSAGEVLNIARLKKKHHKQTEGIGFLSDQKLILADEGADKKGRITIYNVAQLSVN